MGDESRLMKKIRENPSFPIGILGCIGTCVYAAYNYKNVRGTMSLSVYLMQFRVIAQSAVIGCITLGMVYNLGKTLNNDFFNKESKENKD